jgi:CubicO group peptidase (beta-lactamase class C family)
MSVYCNDGFTITEALIKAMTGKSYVQFVHDEILTPLGMANTRYPISAFPAGSYAKAYVKGAAKPQEFVNLFASGGAYSTADGSHRHDVPKRWKSRHNTYSFTSDCRSGAGVAPRAE